MEIKSPVSATLSPEQLAAIQDAVSHYRAVKGGVMPALHAVQGICGNWLPLEALKLLAEGMDIPYPYLYGVMSFYTMFSPTPRGKYIIRLCESPPCHIMGAENLVEMLQSGVGDQGGGNHRRRPLHPGAHRLPGGLRGLPGHADQRGGLRAAHGRARQEHPQRLPGRQGRGLPDAAPHHQPAERLPGQRR